MAACGGELVVRVEHPVGGGVRYVTELEAEQLLETGRYTEVGREGFGGRVRVLRAEGYPGAPAPIVGARERRIVRLREYACEACGATWEQPTNEPVVCPQCDYGEAA